MRESFDKQIACRIRIMVRRSQTSFSARVLDKLHTELDLAPSLVGELQKVRRKLLHAQSPL